MKNSTTGTLGTHWVGCWKVHDQCRDRKIVRQFKEGASMRELSKHYQVHADVVHKIIREEMK